MADLRTTFAGSIPEHYDRILGPAQFGPFARALAELLPADPGGDVLEIACGTGLLTREVRARLAPARRLVASDLSKPMLDYARAHVSAGGIEWREADATQLPFGDGEFACALCAFGMMFVPDKPAAFAEARRVLRSGGTFLFSVWDRIEENPCSLAHAEVVEALAPGDPEVRFRTPWVMHDMDGVRALLDAARFDPVSIEKKRLPIAGVDPLTFATGQTRGTPRGALLEKRGIPLDAVIKRVAERLEALGGAGASFRSHGQAWLISARAI